jgi:replicative superfamily II helicase
MVGELAALKGTLERRRAFFLLPLKALVNDKHQHFARTYGKYGLRTIRATGEIIDDIPALMRGQYDICLMTYEKFAALALGNPHILDHVGTIVVDEVQMITDESRGANLEFILTLLRMRQQTRISPQLIALSAVIGDTNGLERWLGARLLRRDERPVPLEEGIIRADGSFRYLDPTGREQLIEQYIQHQGVKNSSQDWIIPLVKRLVEEGNQVIVFRETRGEARGCANYLARDLGLSPAQIAIDALPTGDPSDASNALHDALMGGVAFHNSNLDREERQVVEEQFRAKDTTLRVISATTTLAMGVNTPAESVVIAGLEHPGPKPYSIAEYKNLVGRAGRLGYSEKGKSFLLAITPHDEHYFWNHYVCGKPEDIQSRFLTQETDTRSMIVRVLAASQRITGRGLDANAIVGFLEGSFGAFQQKQLLHTWAWDQKQLLESLKNLELHKLIEQGKDGNYQLTPLGSLAGEGGIEVESLTRLVEALSPLAPETINDPTLIAAVQLTVELDQVYFPLNKKSTQKEPQTWTGELHHQQVAPVVIRATNHFVNEQHQPTLRAKKAAACLLWITDLPIVEIERILTQFGGAFNGAAGDIRSATTRSCDLLPAVTKVAELLHPGFDLSVRRARLLARLEIGVPAELADLAMYAGNRLTRGDYQRLKKAGICSIDMLEKNSDENVISSLGETRNNIEKLAVIRAATQAYRDQHREQNTEMPILPPYVG